MLSRNESTEPLRIRGRDYRRRIKTPAPATLALVTGNRNRGISPAGIARVVDLSLRFMVWLAGICAGVLVHVPSEDRIVPHLLVAYGGNCSRRAVANRTRIFSFCFRPTHDFY